MEFAAETASTEQDSGAMDLPARWVGHEEGAGQGCVHPCITPFSHMYTMCESCMQDVMCLH